jgi:hypothetical protein
MRTSEAIQTCALQQKIIIKNEEEETSIHYSPCWRVETGGTTPNM